MRIIETKVYKFEELSERQKDLAIEKEREINTEYDWWDSVYEDAERIGLKITSFDDYVCKGTLTTDIEEVIRLIMQEHGEMCETFKTARQFKAEFDSINKALEKMQSPLNSQDEEYSPRHVHLIDEKEEMERRFLQSLLEDYRIILRHEYEYQTSNEAVTETLIANEYEFNEKGEIV